ncbi:hypothetical protein [Marinobacter sp.]|uniref:hypothetical protein n=1 Tax=Marinobacter sp. TaxID=50741 RepID=UPI0034A2F104
MITLPRTIAVLALLAVAPLSLSAEREVEMVEEVLVVLSSASPLTQGMAMMLSTAMLERGARVNVLLCDQAGELALKSYDGEALKPKEATPGQLLRGLLSQGASVNVCGLYLPNSGRDRDELFEGVGIALPPEVSKQMLDSQVRSFTF